MRVGIAISDTSAGMFLGQGILLALIHRDKTGEGQWVHTSLLEAMLSKIDFQGARYTMSGEVAEQQGNFHPTQVPMGVFDSANGQVNLAASTGKMWVNFCQALDAQALLERPEYQRGADRIRHRDQLNTDVNHLTHGFTTAELVERLNAVGVPCGPIYTVGEAFNDPQALHLQMTRSAPHSVLGDINLVRSPINLSACPTPDHFHNAGPAVGEHSAEILLELGYSRGEIEALMASGAVE